MAAIVSASCPAIMICASASCRCRKNRNPDDASKAATHGFLPGPRRRGRYCFIAAPDGRVGFHCKQQRIYKAALVPRGPGGVTKSAPPSLPPDQKAARGRLACLL